MASRQLDEERIFHTARKLPDPEARADYLDQICAGDWALRERVEALLKVHQEDQYFLKSADHMPPTVDIGQITERPGTMIGRYKLMEQIGEGGMGIVYVAEQERPIRRKVALKVIKPGMDSKAIVARFEAERQALAMMTHAHIARVLDAGTTDSGRPYFVMELVKGVPITEYCDKNKLTIRERLALFLHVCQAIQHAHQKGIIHRDIKPSNVLVTLHDGQPMPKVIDFGVAKALNTRLTDKTIYTEHRQIVGTLLYMSPEQAELSGLDIDTRSDIYSLGVLLYELLTGTTPFTQAELDKAGFDQQRRIICDREPPRASVRISSLGETSTIVAEQRRTDVRKLHHLLRGDLDWIVLKALDKDRSRRYDTATSLSQDVERYMAHELVVACPPSLDYRMRKFAQRYRAALITITLVVVALTTGITVATWQAVRANNLAHRLGQTLSNLHRQLVEQAFLRAIMGDIEGVNEMLTTAREAGEISGDAAADENWYSTLHGIAFFHRGDNKQAIEHLSRAWEENPENVSALATLSVAYMHVGDFDKWTKMQERLAKATPRPKYQAYDALFIGYGRLFVDFELAASELENALKEHPWWYTPRSLLASAWAHLALVTEDRALMRRAVNETQVPKQFAGESPYLQMSCLWANYIALELFGRDAELEKEASNLAEQLEIHHPHYLVGALARGRYFERIGNSEKATLAWNELLSKDSGFFHHYAAAGQFGAGIDASELLSLLRPGKEFDSDICRAYILAVSTDSAMREEARTIYARLVGEAESWYKRHLVVQIKLLLGEVSEARAQCKAWLQDAPSSPPFDQYYFRETVEMIAEEAPPWFSIHNPNQMVKWVAHYQVGLLDYADGNRESALEHFTFCAQHGFPTMYRTWAEAFARRLVPKD